MAIVVWFAESERSWRLRRRDLELEFPAVSASGDAVKAPSSRARGRHRLGKRLEA